MTISTTDFILARIGEDEDWATEAAESYLSFNPAHVLAQCAAFREVVEECVALDDDEAGVGLRTAVRILASIWSDHPDWHEGD